MASDSDDHLKRLAAARADKYVGRDGKPPSPDDAAAALEREADLLLASSFAATLPAGDPLSNVPIEELVAVSRDVTRVADEIAAVHLVEGRGGAHVELTLDKPRHKPKAIETANALSRLFEAPVVRQQSTHAGTPRPGHEHADHHHRQPPRHSHYKDDRK